MSSVQRMRHIAITAPGAPEVLQISEGAVPVITSGQVLIKVSAAGVNRPDVLQRMGKYAVPPNASPIPGLEVCGEIVELGDKTKNFSVGDKVCALANGGGYAEYVAVPYGQCLPVPQGLSDIEAAAIPETFFTVWANVFDAGALKPGETLLVHGGSSGIGTAAIQLAKAYGAKVIVTVGSDDKCAACEKLGADLAINYRQNDFVTAVKAATDGKGADVILDMVGGDYVPRNIDAAAMDGRIVIIASLRGREALINIAPIMMKRLVITGSLLRPRSDEQKAQIANALLEHAWPWLEACKVRPVIYQVFPLADASQAHALMESSNHIGKLVLDLSQG